jgi:hypothetical protein
LAALIERSAGSHSSSRDERLGFPLVLGVALLLLLCAAFFVLDRFPNSSDEFTYLFQARTFAGFRLWEGPPDNGVDESVAAKNARHSPARAANNDDPRTLTRANQTRPDRSRRREAGLAVIKTG